MDIRIDDGMFTVNLYTLRTIRNSLADEIGLNLSDMKEYGGHKDFTDSNDPIVTFIKKLSCVSLYGFLGQAEFKCEFSVAESKLISSKLFKMVDRWRFTGAYPPKFKGEQIACLMRICADENRPFMLSSIGKDQPTFSDLFFATSLNTIY
jgi:hypothetical protein